MRVRTRDALIGLLIACFVCLTGAPAAFAQAGDLDPSFGGDGIVATNFTADGDFIWDIEIQADGKIVGGGGSAGGRHFALARYDTDGALDDTFSGDGKVVTGMTGGQDVIHAVAIQDDLKIVVAGQVGGSGGRYGLVRYLPDGTLDDTFGGDGRVMTNLTDRWDHAWGLVIQPDGMILAVGASGIQGGAFSAVRYHPNGTRDTTFGGDGRVVTNFTGGDDWAWSVALQTDGKIVVAGIAYITNTNRSVALVRYNTNGSLDPGFGIGGKVRMNPTSGWDDASGVVIQAADGKIVTAGAVGGSGGRLLVLRLNGDGSPDTTFSDDGNQRTNFTSRDDFAWDVALQEDGKIVAAGSAGLGGGEGRIAVARYGSTGALDPTFGGDGKVLTNVTPTADVATGVAVQSDGSIVVGGEIGGSGGRFVVLRYLGA